MHSAPWKSSLTPFLHPPLSTKCRNRHGLEALLHECKPLCTPPKLESLSRGKGSTSRLAQLMHTKVSSFEIDIHLLHRLSRLFCIAIAQNSPSVRYCRNSWLLSCPVTFGFNSTGAMNTHPHTRSRPTTLARQTLPNALRRTPARPEPFALSATQYRWPALLPLSG